VCGGGEREVERKREEVRDADTHNKLRYSQSEGERVRGTEDTLHGLDNFTLTYMSLIQDSTYRHRHIHTQAHIHKRRHRHRHTHYIRHVQTHRYVYNI
jgi:hypothetical protein